MITDYRKPGAQAGPGKENAEKPGGAGEDDACRCKETSEMSPRQLLALMFKDLAFWKKSKKNA